MIMYKITTSMAQIVGLVLSRLVGLPPNVSLQGTYGFTQKNFVVFFGSILAFDVFFGGLYTGVIWTYVGFAGYYMFGHIARKYTVFQWILVPIASVWFFIFSNFGVFITWYQPTVQSFIQCYTVALPFFAATLVGDVFFGYTYLGYKALVKAKQGNLSSPELA